MSRDNGLLASDAEILRRRAESLAASVEERGAADLVSLLLFRVGGEWYGVPVSDIREIFQGFAVTTLPCTPGHVLGVVNVRGEIISVLDPAVMLGLSVGSVEVTDETPAIVLCAEDVVAALVVDEIGDIAEIDQGDFETAAGIVDRVQAEHLSASVFHDGHMVGVINTAHVLQPVMASRR